MLHLWFDYVIYIASHKQNGPLKLEKPIRIRFKRRVNLNHYSRTSIMWSTLSNGDTRNKTKRLPITCTTSAPSF